MSANPRAKIEVPVAPQTAAALADPHRLEAVGRLVDRLVSPGADDPLPALLESTAAAAAGSGLTREEIEAELAAYNSKRRD